MIQYFDLGLFCCTELGWMTRSIFPALGISNYTAYGFEACKESFSKAELIFLGQERIKLLHLAIGDREGMCRLYHAAYPDGHSIFSGKFNVSAENFEEVPVTRFSTWIRENGIVLEGNFNIIKINIEGAEWELFKDMVASGILQHFNVICGTCNDVVKIKEYKSRVQEYYDFLKQNGIDCFVFAGSYPKTKDKMLDLLKSMDVGKWN